jgi:dTDP-4-dehydrorhamnose 3,5-epimerase
MIFKEIDLKGSYIIELETHEDARGFFARAWCRREMAAAGLDTELAQCNISFNRKKGTLRGMHYQAPPHEETKIVRCTKGGVYDVIVDLRFGSPTYGRHFGVILTAENRRILYVPKSFAHGFLTLEDDTEVFYQMSEFYAPEYARGFRWDDPAFQIQWISDVHFISHRDRTYPDFNL